VRCFHRRKSEYQPWPHQKGGGTAGWPGPPKVDRSLGDWGSFFSDNSEVSRAVVSKQHRPPMRRAMERTTGTSPWPGEARTGGGPPSGGGVGGPGPGGGRGRGGGPRGRRAPSAPPGAGRRVGTNISAKKKVESQTKGRNKGTVCDARKHRSTHPPPFPQHMRDHSLWALGGGGQGGPGLGPRGGGEGAAVGPQHLPQRPHRRLPRRPHEAPGGGGSQTGRDQGSRAKPSARPKGGEPWCNRGSSTLRRVSCIVARSQRALFGGRLRKDAVCWVVPTPRVGNIMYVELRTALLRPSVSGTMRKFGGRVEPISG